MMGPRDIKVPDKVDHTGRDYFAVKDDAARAALLDEIREADRVAFDIETWSDNPFIERLGGSFDPNTGEIAGISVSTKHYSGRYVPFSHIESEFNAPEDYARELIELLASKHLIIHNAGFETKWISAKFGIDIRNYTDTQGMAYLYNPNSRVKLDILALNFFKETLIPYDDTVPFNQYQVDSAAAYASEDTDVCLRLYDFLLPHMATMQFLFKLECQQLPHIVGEIESNGIPLHSDYLKEASDRISLEIDQVAKKLYEDLDAPQYFGEFNINYGKILNSPAKLVALLHGNEQIAGLGLPVVERSAKTKNPSSSASALKKLSMDFPIAEDILYYRELVKLRNSFLDSLPSWVNPVTNRIHCSFLQHHVPTGRFASSDPNMQQIPKHDVAKIRRAFSAPDGYRFVAFDYSQVELRVFASEVQESDLMDAFNRGADLHVQTTSQMLGIPAEEVTEEQRQIGKTLNFGLIYGMTEKGLAYRIEVTEEQAKRLIEAYFRAMPKARNWIDNTVKLARRQGGIRTHFGRWRALPEINSFNGKERGKGERGAVNSIIQGTAADIMKIAMVRADKVIKNRWTKDQVQTVLTIHDDLTFLVHDSVSDEEFIPAIKIAMEFPIKGYVPLKVDVSVGPTWGDLVKWDEGDTPVPPSPSVRQEMQPVLDSKIDPDFSTPPTPTFSELASEESDVSPTGYTPVDQLQLDGYKEFLAKDFTVAKLVCRSDLTESDLEAMRSLFNGGEFLIEIELSDKVLVLPPEYRISASNISIWNDRFGAVEDEPAAPVKVDFA